WLLLFFAHRYDKKWLWGSITLLLFGAMAFDGALLGFQFVGLKENCLICIGVGLALFITLFLLARIQNSKLLALLGIAIWCGGFAANSVLNFSSKTPPLEECSVYSWGGEEGKKGPEMYFIFSLHCSHCSEVMANLAVNLPKQVRWHFVTTDGREQDLQRLAHVLAAENLEKNPFLEVLRIEAEEEVTPIEVPQGLEETIARARTYFVNNGFTGIPVLIARESARRQVTVRGANGIMEYLGETKLVTRQIRFPGSGRKPAPRNGSGGDDPGAEPEKKTEQ
ncbi:MAG TPA: hypothetical protein VJ934_03550, partial [Desulfomicrobiaceae bacterium]|nr:hypothetical protein [Desulfomicrobiaceae bacterium]